METTPEQTDSTISESGSPPDRHYCAGDLLDALIKHLQLKNDAELARLLAVESPTISKIRGEKMAVGASLLLRMHEVSNISVKELRLLMGDRRDVFRGALRAELSSN